MKSFLSIFFLIISLTTKAQFTVGIKLGGLAFHQQKVNPNYYHWSIDKKGRWVGYFGVSLTAGYQFNPYVGVKLIQSILPLDCANRFSGVTHLGIDIHDRVVGWENEKHRGSVSFGPIFYYRKNWNTVPDYYITKGFMKQGKKGVWERKFIWYGGQIQYNFYYNERQAISTNFLPGYPYIYTFMTGVEQRF